MRALPLALLLGACSGGAGSLGSTTGGGSSGVPPGYVGNTVPGTCTPAPGYAGNSKGIGAFCTQGGGQCAVYGQLICAADVETQVTPNNFCLLQCAEDSDCGEDACCHTDTVDHTGQKACVPVLCETDGGTCLPGM